jgi:hypothetical protein
VAAADAATTVNITGTNLAGTVTVNKTNNDGGSGTVLFTVSYSGLSGLPASELPTDSYPILYPANTTAAALSGTQQVFAVGNASNFTINIGGNLPSGIYQWNYHVIFIKE